MTLPNTGAPDEHGLQPLDGLFSSPRKAETPRADQTGELDMDLECKSHARRYAWPSSLTPPASGPGPSTVLAAQKSARLQIPRARSPAKTHLQSPAVKNPYLGPTSSPSRGSIMRAQDTDESDDHTVTRQLYLGKTQLNGRGKRPNGARRPAGRVVEEEEEEEDSVLLDAPGGGDDSMQLVQDDPPPVEAEDEETTGEIEQEERPKPGRRGRPKGRPAKKAPAQRDPSEELDNEPPSRPRGRPSKKAPPKQREPSVESEVPEPEDEPEDEPEVEQESDAVDEEPPPPQRKPGRPSKKAAPATAPKRQKRASPEPDEEPQDRGKKRQKTQAKAPAKPAKKPTGRKPKAQPEPQDPDASILQVQRGPPLPRARGLVSMRRDASIQQTRSGRHSYRPLEYWKNERVEYEADAVREDMFRAGSRMVLPSIREVIRVEEEEKETRKRARPRARKGKGKKRAVEEEEEEEDVEEWEREVGSVEGDVILWEPEHEVNPPGADDHVEVVESRLAVSNGAVQTHDIRGTTFQFAKTLNLSFMGTGVVDMPPGSEKKPKNSRKMQMVFFVFRGKVLVSVNETEFRISTGGQWFVPRGEFLFSLSPSPFPSPFLASVLAHVPVLMTRLLTSV